MMKEQANSTKTFYLNNKPEADVQLATIPTSEYKAFRRGLATSREGIRSQEFHVGFHPSQSAHRGLVGQKSISNYRKIPQHQPTGDREAAEGDDAAGMRKRNDPPTPNEYSLDALSSRSKLLPIPRLNQAPLQHQDLFNPQPSYRNDPRQVAIRTTLNSRCDRLARQPFSSNELLPSGPKEAESAQSLPKTHVPYLFKKYEDPRKIKDVLTSRAQKSIILKVKRQDRAVERFRDTRGTFFYPK